MIRKNKNKEIDKLIQANNSIDKQNVELINNQMIDINDKTYKKVMFLYSAAIKEIKNKVEIIQEELKLFYDYDPIEYISVRLKSPESIIDKLNRKNLAMTYDSLFEKINDIAGIRIVCNFKDDVYRIVQLLENMQDVKVITKKDYLKEPKKSGYMSYHMIVQVPVHLAQGTMYVKVEIQIRTIGMDFWATLEHKLKYKNNGINDDESKKLVKYAKMINNIDDNFLTISNKINERNSFNNCLGDEIGELNKDTFNIAAAESFFDIEKNNLETDEFFKNLNINL